eukprot:bmy_22075T0
MKGAGRRRTAKRRRMGPPPTPTTTGGSCAKPPSAGASFSMCSPAARRPAPSGCARDCGACRGQSGGSSGTAPSGAGAAALALAGAARCARPSSARASLWCSEGGELRALRTPRLRAPASSHQPPVWASRPWPPMCLFVHLFATPSVDPTAPELSPTPPLSFWVTSQIPAFSETALPGPRHPR